MSKSLFLDDLVLSPSFDEVEMLTIWQGVNLNSLPKLSPFHLFLEQNLEKALDIKAKNLGVNSEELAISILKQYLLT